MPPVIIVERNCIMVDGHRYCQDEPMTGRDVGFILLILVVIGLALWATLHLVEQEQWMVLIGLWGVVPTFIGLWLVFS